MLSKLKSCTSGLNMRSRPAPRLTVIAQAVFVQQTVTQTRVNISRARLMTFRRLLQANSQEPRLSEAVAITVKESRIPSWKRAWYCFLGQVLEPRLWRGPTGPAVPPRFTGGSRPEHNRTETLAADEETKFHIMATLPI